VRLLLAEDDDSIAASLIGPLTSAGFDVTRTATGAGALELNAVLSPDVVLLDLGLPDTDGYDVCRSLRAVSAVPIIVVTARSDEFDRVLGLELGADDYMVKPLGVRELVARIRAVLRRSGAGEPLSGEGGGDAHENGDAISVVGPLRIDRRAHRVFLDEQTLALTPKEFDLLAYLAEDPGAVRTRTEILEHVWDANWFGPTKTVDAHVAALRRKLGDPTWIESVRGVGFRLEIPTGRSA
jgi:two-component system response regulator RegX3